MQKAIRNILLLLLCLPLASWAYAQNPAPTEPEADVKQDNTPPRVTLETNLGDITLELYPDKAPITVANFLKYVDAGFYDDTIFHRVIAGFVIQGGGMKADFTRKKTEAPIVNESNNGLRNQRGTISMARTSAPHSATSQFFINLVDNTSLDARAGAPGYAVFGRVIKGMDVVDRIASVNTGSKFGHRDVPLTDIIIKKASRQ